MTSRPDYVDLRSLSHNSSKSGLAHSRGLPSPRRPHVDGDIPPELSPLDAFALQGRLLAKQLDDSAKNGKRISRLPPITIANSLAQNRPGFFRSASADAESFPEKSVPRSTDDGGLAMKTELAVPPNRPVSIHPRLSGIPIPDANDIQRMPDLRARRKKSLDAPPAPPIFTPRRSNSPETYPTSKKGVDYKDLSLGMRPKRSFDSQRVNGLQRGPSGDSLSSRRYNSNALAPPGSPTRRQASSIRSVPAESSDDDAASMGASFVSLPRKLSSSSGLSNPGSPMSPVMGPPRSPSISSEYSIGGGRTAKQPFNFSRPMSRASRPSSDMPSRQDSTDGNQPYIFTEDIHTPVSMNSDDYVDSQDASGPVPSYIYSRFDLPRGRMLQRNSLMFLEDNQQRQFQWSTPLLSGSNVDHPTPRTVERPLSPPSPPREVAAKSQETLRPRTPEIKRPNTSYADERRPSMQVKGHSSHPSSPSVSSGLTIKARSNHSNAISTDISAEEHLEKGIACHESGSFQESTYHLRIAAKQNNPTAMLLYALACRHGWGMRKNEREGVQWLRKAADCASLEVAEDEELTKEGKMGDYNERKTRRAQFALSIYELGVSHMNGWGIEQDKGLALRCFEIAACECTKCTYNISERLIDQPAWGDGDAMTEAGFCYTQGIGCKKDLKKAAKFYRMAEAKGVSMIGNSW